MTIFAYSLSIIWLLGIISHALHHSFPSSLLAHKINPRRKLGEEDGTVYEEPSTSPDRKNVNYMRWVRYVLDNFATVAEAVEGMKAVATTKAKICSAMSDDGQGSELGAHMAIEDIRERHRGTTR